MCKMGREREKREITNISEMFLFLLTYGLFLSSSFFLFISCSVLELPGRQTCVAFPSVRPLQMSYWQGTSDGGQLPVFSKQAGPLPEAL